MKEKKSAWYRGISLLLGALGFVLIYGVRILDVSYVDWVENAGGDLTQSWYGWRFFSNSAWHWPLGLMEGVAPDLTSIIYVDSVPIFNVIFKLFRGILPAESQFFGIWGIVCFMLSGLLGYELVYTCTRKNAYSLCAAVFFIFNNIMIQRLYTHTALAANWIILLGILVVVKSSKLIAGKKILAWIGVFFLCVSVNIYYIPILGVLMFMYCIYDFLNDRRRWKESVGIFAGSLVAVFVSFYLYGGFYHMSVGDAAPSGLGYYCANINSLYNPMEYGRYLTGYGRVLRTLPMATDGQYEGYAYLGAGLILLGIFAVAGLFFCNREKLGLYLKRNKLQLIIGGVTVLMLYVLSFGTIVSFNQRVLFTIPYPQFILKILAVFRSTGRFLWGVWDIYAVVVIASICKEYRKKAATFLACFCVLVQLYDLSYFCVNRHSIYAVAQQEYETSLSSDEWEQILGGKKQIFMFNHAMLRLNLFYDIADKALDNGMSINDFYYSRRDAETIDNTKNEEWNRIINGDADSGKVYVFDLAEDVLNLEGKLHFYRLDGVWIGTAEKVADVCEIEKIALLENDPFQQSEGRIEYEGTLGAGTYVVEMQGSGLAEGRMYVNEQEYGLELKYDNQNCYTGEFVVPTEGAPLVINYDGQMDSIRIYEVQ